MAKGLESLARTLAGKKLSSILLGARSLATASAFGIVIEDSYGLDIRTR